MFFALFPLKEAFELEAKLFKESSSSLWDSSVVDDSELESPVDFGGSFLDPVIFDLHFDFPLSGGATSGVVQPLSNASGSNETVETDCSRD
jgi:hypothetical protein